MTAKEFAEVVKKVHHDEHVYADADNRWNDSGNDTSDRNHMFDHNHTEDVFPY